MVRSNQLMRGLCATTALAALLAVAPVQLVPDLQHSGAALKAKSAFARGGGDDRGGDDHGGGSGHGSDDRGGDDHGGGSGHGGDDHGGSGHGSDDRGGDDHGGGSGHGSDDRGGDDHGGGSGHGGDDRGGDDHGGRSGRSGDDRASDDHRGNSGRGGDDRGGAKVEIDGDKIEVIFADGTKQEIEDGRFEQKDVDGRTVVERPATREDFDRLKTAAASPGASIERVSSRTDGSKVEISGHDIEVTHADGWKEEIDNDRYEMKDPNNNTVVERAATGEDRSRLEGLAGF
jgi:hypothetical protein